MRTKSEFAAAQLAGATHWLLFLSPTCFEGEVGERLAAEVAAALQAGVKPLMLWSPEKCEFHDIIQATPRALVVAGLYGPLAIEWRSKALRAVSLRLATKALGAQVVREAALERLRHSCQWLAAACVRCLRGRARTGMLESHHARSQGRSSGFIGMIFQRQQQQQVDTEKAGDGL